MATNIDARPNDDGSAVVITITQPGAEGVSASVPVGDLGYFVAGLMGEAVECARTSGDFARLSEKENGPLDLKYVAANDVAVAQADQPDLAVLIFAFGASEISIGIRRADLKQLGAALLTLSADANQAH